MRKHNDWTMQYLLTQQEYELLTRAKRLRTDGEKAELQALCTLAARHIPAITPSYPADAKPRPWGCILVREDRIEYCDECPAREVCPNEHKEWSK